MCDFIGQKYCKLSPDKSQWSQDQSSYVKLLLVELLHLEAFVLDRAPHPYFSDTPGFPVSSLMIVPTSLHPIKHIVKTILVDNIMLSVPGGKVRDDLQRKILDSSSKNLNSFHDFVYAYYLVDSMCFLAWFSQLFSLLSYLIYLV